MEQLVVIHAAFVENTNRCRTGFFADWPPLHLQFVTFSYDKVSGDSTS